MTEPWPTELRLDKEKRILTVSYDDGQSFALPAELLRVLSPSAEVQGHSPSERKTVAGKKNVAVLELHPVGNYAVRIGFEAMIETPQNVIDTLQAIFNEPLKGKSGYHQLLFENIALLATRAKAIPDVIPLWYGEGDLPTPGFICDAAQMLLAANAFHVDLVDILRA